jgi:hypothetical protein
MEHLALKIIRQASNRPSGQKAGDLLISISLPGFHEGIEDAPYNARSPRDRFSFG